MTSRKERPINNPLFTREMIRQRIKENDLRDGKSILDFLKSSFGEFIQEALNLEYILNIHLVNSDFVKLEKTPRKDVVERHYRYYTD